MRTFVIVAAVAALAAAPCAWDTGPGGLPTIAAFLASQAGSSASGPQRALSMLSNEKPWTAPIESREGGDREAL